MFIFILSRASMSTYRHKAFLSCNRRKSRKNNLVDSPAKRRLRNQNNQNKQSSVPFCSVSASHCKLSGFELSSDDDSDDEICSD